MPYDPDLLLKAINHQLAANPRNALSSIAGAAGGSRRTIERAIREKTGVCFARYREMRLMEKALALIMDGGLHRSIKQVALDLGYRSPAAFTRFIKSRTGKPPTAIRREVLRLRGRLATSAYSILLTPVTNRK